MNVCDDFSPLVVASIRECPMIHPPILPSSRSQAVAKNQGEEIKKLLQSEAGREPEVGE